LAPLRLPCRRYASTFYLPTRGWDLGGSRSTRLGLHCKRTRDGDDVPACSTAACYWCDTARAFAVWTPRSGRDGRCGQTPLVPRLWKTLHAAAWFVHLDGCCCGSAWMAALRRHLPFLLVFIVAGMGRLFSTTMKRNGPPCAHAYPSLPLHTFPLCNGGCYACRYWPLYRFGGWLRRYGNGRGRRTATCWCGGEVRGSPTDSVCACALCACAERGCTFLNKRAAWLFADCFWLWLDCVGFVRTVCCVASAGCARWAVTGRAFEHGGLWRTGHGLPHLHAPLWVLVAGGSYYPISPIAVCWRATVWFALVGIACPGGRLGSNLVWWTTGFPLA